MQQQGDLRQSESQPSNDRGQQCRMGARATPKCKESAYWKQKEREEFGGYDHEISYHHALSVGHNATNAFLNTI